MARLPTSGTIKVSDLKAADGGLAANNNNITFIEGRWMNGNASVPPRAVSSGTDAFCFPNQAQKVSATNWTYSPPVGFTNSDYWKSTALSEFYNSYNDKPSVSIAPNPTGEKADATYFYGAIRCTASQTVATAPYSFLIVKAGGGAGSVRETGGTTPDGWFIGNFGSGTQRDIKITTQKTAPYATWQVYVRDANNCGQNSEFASNVQGYPS